MHDSNLEYDDDLPDNHNDDWQRSLNDVFNDIIAVNYCNCPAHDDKDD